MKRSIFVCALLVAATASMAAQEPNPYQGTSNPPPDDQIMTSGAPQAKPRAGTPMTAQPAVPTEAEPQSAAPAEAQPQPANPPQADEDSGIVQVAPSQQAPPAAAEQPNAYDPDGDIVHPHPLRPGELGEGTNIRVQLMQRLSTTSARKGETFRTVVASDVLQDGQVVIPAGAEIVGRITQVSSGHPGGHGFMRLQPEAVILAGGSRFMLHAQTTATPGSRTRLGSEGVIAPGSRLKRDGIEYGGAVGAGAVAGAFVAGPPGALTGGLIGAGAVSVHLLVNHPQATLDSGTMMVFTLTEPLDMVATPPSGN